MKVANRNDHLDHLLSLQEEDSPSNWLVLGSQSKNQVASELSERKDIQTARDKKPHFQTTQGHSNRKIIKNPFKGSEVIVAGHTTLAATTLNDCNSLYYPGSQGSYGTSNNHETITKISAEELIRNYTNANFMPQKQANDRLQLLCQSKELNPLISLTIDSDQQPTETPRYQMLL